jgi:5-deoxy-glucuronate isomerase
VARPPVLTAVSPGTVGWRYLSFAVHRPVTPLNVGQPDQEVAIVPLRGAIDVVVHGRRFELRRTSVFEEMPHVLYAPPGADVTIAGSGECAVGSAPAEGRYPVRLFAPAEMRSEIRGGGAARRQVVHLLNAPLPAERLILFEVYVPRGAWSGWPPHCHDGYEGSPYLEETYYFRTDPADGFCLHRNWRVDEPFDETFVAHDGDLVTVPKGYHCSVGSPGSHMYFLNFLAGELLDDARSTPPCFHPSYTWIEADWEANGWTLPKVTA